MLSDLWEWLNVAPRVAGDTPRITSEGLRKRSSGSRPEGNMKNYLGPLWLKSVCAPCSAFVRHGPERPASADRRCVHAGRNC